jgi:hypothetical protein
MMGYKLKGRIVTAILLSLLLFTAFSSFADEKEKLKRFEVLFSGGASYATSRFGFSPGVSFSYYLRDNLALSLDFGVAYHIPELDFYELGVPPGGAKGIHINLGVDEQSRLFSSLSAEYNFDLSPEIKPFISAGLGWCRDYNDFELWIYKVNQTEAGVQFELLDYIPFQLDESITCSGYGRYKYRKSNFPLLILGGGIRYSLGSNTFLKVMVRVMDLGGDFATYQLITSWGFRF